MREVKYGGVRWLKRHAAANETEPLPLAILPRVPNPREVHRSPTTSQTLRVTKALSVLGCPRLERPLPNLT